jgi:hypothetical protein
VLQWLLKPAPFDDALFDFGATDLPVALTDAAGVATTAQLTEEFPLLHDPHLQLHALRAFLMMQVGLAVLRSQFDVRSTRPTRG